MPKETLWETICHLAGKEGTEPVSYSRAVSLSAVTPEIAQVEVKRMVEDGLVLTPGDDTIILTEKGRISMSDLELPADVPNVHPL